MLFTELLAEIEKIAPLREQASWDKSGLQVASHRAEVTKLAVALDPTPSSVSTALEKGADCILTHHPLSLSPDLPRTLNSYHSVLSMLFKSDVPLYAAHTSLDVQPDGPAGWLARHLCLVHPQILEETGERCGFGLVGNLPKPCSMRELLQKLEERISLATATFSGQLPETVRRVAYCTGSGSSLLKEAEEAGADVFITGDVKYHTALEARCCLLDVGHHSLEEVMAQLLSQTLKAKLPALDIFFVPSSSPMHRALDCK